MDAAHNRDAISLRRIRFIFPDFTLTATAPASASASHTHSAKIVQTIPTRNTMNTKPYIKKDDNHTPRRP